MVVGATADPVVIAQIRAKARSILDALERETEDDEELHPSWVRGAMDPLSARRRANSLTGMDFFT